MGRFVNNVHCRSQIDSVCLTFSVYCLLSVSIVCVYCLCLLSVSVSVSVSVSIVCVCVCVCVCVYCLCLLTVSIWLHTLLVHVSLHSVQQRVVLSLYHVIQSIGPHTYSLLPVCMGPLVHLANRIYAVVRVCSHRVQSHPHPTKWSYNELRQQPAVPHHVEPNFEPTIITPPLLLYHYSFYNFL